MRKLILVLLIILFAMPVVFGEDVEIIIPEHNISINGYYVENDKEQYPFIAYKGITYLPMTWDFARALGLNLSWSEESGLALNSSSSADGYIAKSLGKYSRKNKASIVTSPVSINGKQIDHATAEYPILSYNDITYFPMTYQYMASDFGLSYEWDNKEGFSLGTPKDMPVKMPESTVITKTFYLKDIPEGYDPTYDGIYEVGWTDHCINIGLHYEYDEALTGKYFDMIVRVFDVDDKLIVGMLGGSGKYYRPQIGKSVYRDLDFGFLHYKENMDHFEVELTFYEPCVIAYNNYTFKQEVPVEYVDFSTFSYDSIAEKGVKYFSPDTLDSDYDLGMDYHYLAHGLNEEEYKFFDKNGRFFNEFWHTTVNRYGEDYGFKHVDDYDQIEEIDDWFRDMKLYKDGEFIKKSFGDAILLYDAQYNLLKVIINVESYSKGIKL